MLSINTHEINIEAHRKVNKPKFPSHVRIHDGTTKQLVYDADVSANNSNITYFNQTVTVSILDSFEWHTNTEYNITMDEGVLYSDSLSNSTNEFHRISSNFKVSNDENTPTNLSVTKHLTSDSTQTDASSNMISTTTVTTTTKSSTTARRALVQGEQSATRSAHLGMILGIILFLVIVSVEIIYFKYVYHGRQPRGI
ncbi:unnamed protein product [Rotaria magnacalcarata]|uniref:Uncharacterized protein n=2 Tax=Rotaria magnacalcarata TaxID=392030 RepID=A0A815KB50_9BILA|nr:unnamed protein product [Rotaria magnacalcarata]CAF3922756.1 unnamed protein product [Rotaria magnacalcarata]CAF4065560.1 unnamed protein product [Rotaria magnacalcarata]